MTVETLPPLTDLQPASPDMSQLEHDHGMQLRNEWLDDLLDPEKTLPHITLTEDPSVLASKLPEPGVKGYRVYDKDQQPVGLFRLATEPDPYSPEGTVEHLTWIQTTEPGKGYGKAMYLELLKLLPDTATLVSDTNLKQGSFKVWEWLESRHLATKNEGKIIKGSGKDEGYIWNENSTPLFRSTVPSAQSLQKAYVEGLWQQ